MLNNFINQFPYSDYHEMNLDWIIKIVKALYVEMVSFEASHTIQFADPIQWDITKQYEAYTIVSDEDTSASYMSKVPVPAGISLSNSEYWLILGSLIIDTDARNAINDILDFITNAYESGTTASSNRYIGDYVVVSGKLYIVTDNISSGSAYVENTNIAATTIENMIIGIINKAIAYVTPEQFGAVGNGVNDDTEALQAALDSNKGIVLCAQGKVYRTTDTVYIGSNTIFNLNGSTIYGNIVNPELPVIKNKDYGMAGVSNICITNGTIQGSGDDNNVGDQGHAISFWVVDNAIISNIKTRNTCGDGLGMREVSNAIIQNVDIGNYGRNGISPTAGSFVFENVNVSGTAFVGADPGRGFDAEPNSASDQVKASFFNCTFTDMTFVDFRTPEGGIFLFELSFNNVIINGRPFGLRFKATNHVKAHNIIVNNVKVNIVANTGKNIIVENVSNIIFDSVYISHVAPSTANTTAFSGTFDHITFKNMDLSMFSGNGYSVRGGFTNCTFDNMIMRFFAETGFSGNRFINSTISYYRGSADDDSNNTFINTDAPTSLLDANNYWGNARTKKITLTSNQSLKITRSTAYYSYLITVRVSGNNDRSLYFISGKAEGSSKNSFDKLVGNDTLSATVDNENPITTLTNLTNKSIVVAFVLINGDIPSFEIITP